MVSGWKYPRKDPLEKRLFSFIFNRVTAMLTGVKLHDMNCGFKVYRVEVVKHLSLYGDLHRYIPILAQAEGFSVGEAKVKHHPRRFGRSKYGLERIPKGFFDLLTVLFLTKYKKRPMHFFAGIGSLFAVSGISVFVGLLALHFFLDIALPTTALGLAGGLCILTGLLLLGIGLLGELIITKKNNEANPSIHRSPCCGDTSLLPRRAVSTDTHPPENGHLCHTRRMVLCIVSSDPCILEHLSLSLCNGAERFHGKTGCFSGCVHPVPSVEHHALSARTDMGCCETTVFKRSVRFEQDRNCQ